MKWWLYQGGEVSDEPYSKEELREISSLTEETLVCLNGEEDWQPAGSVPALVEIFENGDVEESESSGGLNVPTEIKKKKEKEKQKREQREEIYTHVLELVAREDFGYGVNKTAGVLAGSQAEKVKESNLVEHPFHGTLDDFSVDRFKDEIESMLDTGLLEKEQVGDYAYVLEVAQVGEDHLASEIWADKTLGHRDCNRIQCEILKIVEEEDFQYGILKTAHFLVGSENSKITKHDLQHHQRHGELDEYNFEQIKWFIQRMVQKGLLSKQEVGEYAYVLEVTGDGQEILKGKTPPSIRLPESVRK